ncbi:hypothetical protein [Ralstonia pseudosolanacearum]|uniref:Transmembrane protein n=1 Tax=Ralstonia solanacearum TaxID=305 RepID=A0AA92EHG7_RALSL|nr:hypothetical protein [Ralstonia pseudosolanacearum]QCX51306.1 hypothetical protein E7Z57_19650 [Ralstonia pseudosolanacearum]
MLELGVGASILRIVGWLYIATAVVALSVVIWYPKRIIVKVLGVGLVLWFFGHDLVDQILKDRAQQKRLSIAKARIDEHCKSAGRRIYREVKGVDGIFLLNARVEDRTVAERYRMNDPYHANYGYGEDYILEFARGHAARRTNVAERIGPKDAFGFDFVEVPDPSGKGVLRYTTPMSKWESDNLARNGGGIVPLVKEHRDTRSARYGIKWTDLSTKEDRDYWIAGGLISVVDMETGEVLAEDRGYMYDPRQGEESGGRDPWLIAKRHYACPQFDRYEPETNFIYKVVQPKR